MRVAVAVTVGITGCLAVLAFIYLALNTLLTEDPTEVDRDVL